MLKSARLDERNLLKLPEARTTITTSAALGLRFFAYSSPIFYSAVFLERRFSSTTLPPREHVCVLHKTLYVSATLLHHLHTPKTNTYSVLASSTYIHLTQTSLPENIKPTRARFGWFSDLFRIVFSTKYRNRCAQASRHPKRSARNRFRVHVCGNFIII